MPPRAAHRRRAATDTLCRTKQLAAKVLASGSSIVVSSLELSNVVDELNLNIHRKTSAWEPQAPGLWASIGEEYVPALNALYDLALRRSSRLLAPAVSDSLRTGYAALRWKLNSELSNIVYDEEHYMPAFRAQRTVLQLLSLQAVRCLAVLLKEAVTAIEPQLPRPPRRSLQLAREALFEAQQFLQVVQKILSSKAEHTQQRMDLDSQIISLVASELLTSQLLEHWSRLLLHLSACESGVDDAARQLAGMATTLYVLDSRTSRRGDLFEFRHDLLVDSPSLGYLLSSHMIGLCAWLDGGPTYGMPPAVDEDEDEGGAGAAAAAPAGAGGQLRHRAPLFCPRGARLRPGSPGSACTTLAEWALRVWGDVLECTRLNLPAAAASAAAAPLRLQPIGLGVRRLALVPPLHAPATLEVCLRLVSAVVEGRALGGRAPTPAATGAGRRGVQARGQGPRLADEPDEVYAFAVLALRCGRTALGEEVMAAERVTPATQVRLRRWFSALVGYMGMAAAAHRGEPGDHPAASLSVSDVFTVAAPRRSNRDGLPPAPTPCVAAALDAGYLAALDNLLRSMERRKGFDRIKLIDQHEVSPEHRPLRSGPWDQLLAFGDPHETAPLLSTLARLIRSTVSEDQEPRLIAYLAIMAASSAYMVCERAVTVLFCKVYGSNQAIWAKQLSLLTVECALTAQKPLQGAEQQQQQQLEEEVVAAVQEIALASHQHGEASDGAAAAMRALCGKLSGMPLAQLQDALQVLGAQLPGTLHEAVRASRQVALAALGRAAAGGADGGSAASGAEAGAVDGGAVAATVDGAPGDPTAPGLPRLGLLTSYMMVHLLPATRYALLQGYLHMFPSAADSLAKHLCVLVNACTLAALAYTAAGVPPAVQDTGASSGAGGPDAAGVVEAPALDAAGTGLEEAGPCQPQSQQPVVVGPSASAGAPSAPSPSSSREEWRTVLLEDLRLDEVLGTALGLLAREERVSGAGAAICNGSPLIPLADAVIACLVTMVVATPAELLEALTSTQAERAAARIDTAVREGGPPVAAAASAPAGAGGSSSSSIVAGVLPPTIERGLRAVDASGYYLRLVSSIAQQPHKLAQEVLLPEAVAVLHQVASLLPPPSRLLELLPVDLSGAEAAQAARPGGSRGR